jgi:hypothetical protein
VLLADHLAKLKSMVTLNTSTVAQAVIGGYLLDNGCSLKRATAREAEVYRRNLAALLDGLESVFAPAPGAPRDVSWNTPQGGMFVVVTLPFPADDDMLEYSASQFGVLWTPMHHFYGGTGGFHQARLSFSVLTPEQIALGVERLGKLVQDQRASGRPPDASPSGGRPRVSPAGAHRRTGSASSSRAPPGVASVYVNSSRATVTSRVLRWISRWSRAIWPSRLASAAPGQ